MFHENSNSLKQICFKYILENSKQRGSCGVEFAFEKINVTI